MKTTLKFYTHASFLAGIALIVFVGVFFAKGIPAHAATCLQLSSDLSYGASDQVSGGPVMQIQDYLQNLGYLEATPTGYFGPATLYAVKTFQTINNISATGYVGPLTRTAIGQKTCGSVSSSVQSNSSTGATPTISPTANAVAVPNEQTQNVVTSGTSNVGVTSPAVGQVLPIGSTQVIGWNTTPSNLFNIVLEQPGGAGGGIIASNLPINYGNQYIWKVGSTFNSSLSQASLDVATGTYRVRLENPVTGPASTDEVSGWFTLSAEPFTVSSIMPTYAFADNITSIVLYGAGFTPSTSVYFDSNLSGIRAQDSYVSPDGTVLVFTIPTETPTGPHTLYITNGYNLPYVTEPFTVNLTQ